MPKKGETQTTEGNGVFSKGEWIGKVKERIMRGPWGTVVIKDAGALTMEIVRIGETENLMLRIRTPNIKNTLKLTRREHVESLLELARAIANNEKNLADKLTALMEIFPRGGRVREEEEL
jgi:hypothetical protein